jgi:hypothetical protein
MEHCSKRIGDAYFRTPRNTITSFVNLLSVLEQNSQATWQDILGTVEIKLEINPDLDSPMDGSETMATTTTAETSIPEDGEENLASFRL